MPLRWIFIATLCAPLTSCELFIDEDKAAFACPYREDTVAVIADAYNWIDSCSNRPGIQGYWWPYSDGYSTAQIRNPGNGGMCASGVVQPQIQGSDLIWGGGIGFNLCEAGQDGGSFFTIENCPRSLSSLLGFRLTVTGSMPASGIRVIFYEKGRDQSAYVTVPGIGIADDYYFAEAKVGYDAFAPPIDIGNIRNVLFQVPAASSEVTYDFCIENIEAIVLGPMQSYTPEWGE